MNTTNTPQDTLQDTLQQKPGPDSDDPALQGEGNYAAAHRHRESVENFVDSGKVEEAARDAAPQSPADEREMQEAEEAGRARAKP